MALSEKRIATLVTAFIFSFILGGNAAEPGRVELAGHVPPVVLGLVAKSPVPATNVLSLAIGLPLRNEDKLDEFIHQLYDPASTNFHKFLTPQDFAARFGPSEQDYETVKQFASSNGLSVVGTYSNRVVLDVRGPASAVERAFHITLSIYRHPTEARDFFAPDTEPSVPVNMPVNDMFGLSDYAKPHPMVHPAVKSKTSPLNQNGSGMKGSYQGADFRNAYIPGSSLTGSGQVVALFELDGYYPDDVTNYETDCGYTNVPVQNVLVDNVSGTPGYSGVAGAVVEVSLDIETAIAMAPGLAEVLVYEGNNPYDVYNQIASDNLAKQISSSWYFKTGYKQNWLNGHGTSTLDSVFKVLNAQGQALFQASGDSDAYTGSQAFNSTNGPIPIDSVYLTSVGGTSLTMNGSGVSWNSETVWNYANDGGNDADVGSGGGVSLNYKIPSWQTNVSMAGNNGSTANRNVPDVALTADWIFVVHDNGSSDIVAGTSCAAPLWAGFCALANQYSTATTGTNLGFLNPTLYTIASSSVYSSSFHDITTGNNTGTQTPGLYNAVPGYDLATGLGTPSGTNLINALVWPPPMFISQPVSKNVANGVNVTFTATATSTTPLAYFWLCNGTNLSDGGNVSGTATNILSITAATTNNSGSYQLVVSNATGFVISSPAILNVGFIPTVSVVPASLTALAGSTAVFTATPGGSAPFGYRWKKNGTNFAGATITGTNSSVLTLSGVTTNSAANYTVVVTNLFGSVTSSIVPFTVVLPPAITKSSVTNRTIQCGSNNVTFTVTATGTSPLSYQWSLDGTPVANAINSSFSVTNLHLPNHTVSVQITNLYGTLSSNAVLTVQDTVPPVIVLNGSNPMILQLGSTFTDPGATATDLCMGAVGVTATGLVNTNVVGTNTITYTANDGDGNIGTATRTVIVRDTTPPTILWSFTNLVLTANSNCVGVMPNVTGTNYILATDLSSIGKISQIPTNNSILPLGTNTIVIAVADVYSNTAYSTNTIVVQDQTPPVITLNGSNPMFSELGQAFVDPGAAAYDNCAGVVPVTATGSVNINVVCTNTVTYTASDGNGNTNTAVRTVIVRDTTPPTILWSFTNLVLAANSNCVAAMPDVTGTNYILATDLSGVGMISQTPTNNSILPVGTNIIVIAVADVYSNTAYSTNIIVVQDQSPPMITLNGSNPMFSELGQAFVDPGATASTACAGAVPVTVSGLVNTSVIGTNTLSYTATNAGNTSTATRIVIVRDTTPPTISWSFTNLVLAASSNCVATMHDVTGTNYILAVDLSGVGMISQIPTNNSILALGTNIVVIAVADVYSNTAYSTNIILVQDQTPPVIFLQPQSQTNTSGANAGFSVAASACTPLSFQWFFNQAAMTSQTNSALTLSNLNLSLAGNYAVVVSASGGSVTSAVAILTVSIPTGINGLSADPGGGFRLNLIGTPGYSYVLESTTNLSYPINWSFLATNTMGTNGVWQFTDVQATNFTQQFYRLILGP